MAPKVGELCLHATYPATLIASYLVFYAKFRIYNFNSTVDYIVVGSDSGRISILEYNPLKNNFEKVCILISSDNFRVELSVFGFCPRF